MTRPNRYSRDQLPYDRELIRSGGVGSGRAHEASSRPSRRSGYRAARPRPQRGRSIGRAIRTVLLLAVIAVGATAVLIGLRAASFNASVSTAGFPSTALLGPLNGDDRVNVLMVGYGGGDHDGAYLADSIQVLSIDPESDTSTTIPIPRDLWIEGVASFARNGKINEVFSAGHAEGGLERAAERLAEVVSEVTGLEVDHWMSIDFAGFREMVDAVGGVTIQNPVAFRYTTGPGRHAAGQWNSGGFDAGEIHLDGDEALTYARARYTSVVSESTDFARSVRQARILRALRSELGDGGITAIPDGLRLMDAMEDRVFTDLSAIDLFLLSSHIDSDRRIELEEGPVLTATTNTIGQYILIPTGWTGPGNYGGIRAYLSDRLAQPVAPDGTDAP